MKTCLKLCLASLSFVALGSYANGITPAPVPSPVPVISPSVYEGGFVIGGEGGYGHLQTSETDLRSSRFIVYPNRDVKHELGQEVWGAHLGYDWPAISLNSHPLFVGLEAGFKDLGKSTYDFVGTDEDISVSETWNLKIQEQAIDALLTARYFVFNGFNVLGKAGVAYVQTKTTQHFHFQNQPAEFSETYDFKATRWNLEPEFAVGLSYFFNPHLDFYIVYDYIGGRTDNETDYPDFENIFLLVHNYASHAVFAGMDWVL